MIYCLINSGSRENDPYASRISSNGHASYPIRFDDETSMSPVVIESVETDADPVNRLSLINFTAINMPVTSKEVEPTTDTPDLIAPVITNLCK